MLTVHMCTLEPLTSLACPVSRKACPWNFKPFLCKKACPLETTFFYLPADMLDRQVECAPEGYVTGFTNYGQFLFASEVAGWILAALTLAHDQHSTLFGALT